MSNDSRIHGHLPHDWAQESHRPWLGNAYGTVPELADVFWTRFFGPTRRHQGQADFIPQSYRFHDIEACVRIACVGDVLPAWNKHYQVAPCLRVFLADADYLVLNLEGVASDDRRVVNAYKHNSRIFQFLESLFPPAKTVLCCANNHAADCGWRDFQRFYISLKSRGFLVVGRRDEPWLKLPEGVLICNGTQWSNVPGPFLSKLEDAVAVTEPAHFRLLSPHWGWEMHLYPPRRLVEMARRHLPDWDMIVGHHSHCPQPITDIQGKLVAYSMGNFYRGDGSSRGMHGLCLKVDVGPDDTGRWRAGAVSWTFLRPMIENGSVRMVTSRTCSFFPAIPARE